MIKGKHIPETSPTFGLISLSAPEAVLNPEVYNNGKKALEDRGIRLVEGSTVHSRYLYLADTPEKIANDLHEMFLNNNIDAIMAVGGGTCMNKVLPYLDMNLIASHIKPLVGISNITALLIALENAGIVAFHGPFLLWSYGIDGTPTDYTHDNLMDAFRGYSGKLPKLTEWKSFRSGRATGKAIGGNIFTISTIIGTKYCPVDLFRDSILFLEDIGEEYDKLDASLTHLKHLGVFENVKGVVFGKMVGCTSPEGTETQLIDLFGSVLDGYDFPVIYDCDFGHVPDNLTIPFGCQIEMDASDHPEITLLEKGVE